MTYLYPDHLRARATLWLWDLRDIGFIGIGAVFSIACFSVSDILVPMVLTTVYGFLSIQFDPGFYPICMCLFCDPAADL